MSNEAPFAVVDIGSNSIKVLIAERAEDGFLKALKFKTLDVRIGKGINRAAPELSEAAMESGVKAVSELVEEARTFHPKAIALVATSAVRDARNGEIFKARITDATGLTVRILSGDEEANLIGRGLTSDRSLADLHDFYVFDLGGGSLECLAFRNRAIERALSLQLGCVRLTERFVTDPQAPLNQATLQAIKTHVTRELESSGFTFSLPPGAVAIGTGGTVTTARIILAAREGKTLEQTDSLVTLEQLQELLATTSRLCLEDRKRLPGIPAARADVFPTALATLVAVAEKAHFHAYRNSVYNLRWGVADALSRGEFGP